MSRNRWRLHELVCFPVGGLQFLESRLWLRTFLGTCKQIWTTVPLENRGRPTKTMTLQLSPERLTVASAIRWARVTEGVRHPVQPPPRHEHLSGKLDLDDRLIAENRDGRHWPFLANAFLSENQVPTLAGARTQPRNPARQHRCQTHMYHDSSSRELLPSWFQKLSYRRDQHSEPCADWFIMQKKKKSNIIRKFLIFWLLNEELFFRDFYGITETNPLRGWQKVSYCMSPNWRIISPLYWSSPSDSWNSWFHYSFLYNFRALRSWWRVERYYSPPDNLHFYEDRSISLLLESKIHLRDHSRTIINKKTLAGVFLFRRNISTR